MPAYTRKLLDLNPPARWLVAALYVAALTLVLLQSSAHPLVGPAAPKEFDLGWEIFLTTGHVVGFSLLVSAVWWALITVAPSRRALVTALVFAVVLGMVSELLQGLVPDRSPSWFDLLVDWGVATATVYLIRTHAYRLRLHMLQ